MRPFAETGGLGNVVSSLAVTLAKKGHTVKVFLPRYQGISQKKYKIKKIMDPLLIPLGQSREHTTLYEGEFRGVGVYFIDQPFFYDRLGLYGDEKGDYEDNELRFILLSRGILEALKRLEFSPDIIHCHDWQTGLIPAFLKKLYKEEFPQTRSVFSIHNLAFQGNFPSDSFSMTGFKWEEFDGGNMEFWGKVSFLKSAITYADRITTVSQAYAEEIQTEKYGCGMEQFLQKRTQDLTGIINGIDASEWDPSKKTGTLIPFSSKDLTGKVKNKAKLQRKLGLAVDNDIFLVGIVGRLTEQKGLDLILSIFPEIFKENIQFAFLGTGDKRFETELKKWQKRYPKTLSVSLEYNVSLSKEIFAGIDLLLMPSSFEPCGLGQMISMRYGAPALVRGTGGLGETVKNYIQKTGEGTGFVFKKYAPESLEKTLKTAIRLFDNKKSWVKIQANCFREDFSWSHQTQVYEDLYKSLTKTLKQVKRTTPLKVTVVRDMSKASKANKKGKRKKS
jgi:starch synthase